MTDIAGVNDDVERQIKWAVLYYEDWNQLPAIEQQTALEKFWKHRNLKGVNEMILDSDGYKKMVETMGKQAANKAMVSGLNRLVAQEIVKASVGGATSAAGRRGAVFIAEETARLAAARGANVAVTGVKALASLPVGITSAVGEMAGDAIASAAGIENHHIKNAFGAGGAIAGGAAAGAIVGGPIGAAAGAVVGVGSWAVGQGIKALLRIGQGPDDNWCFVEIGNTGVELCVGSYAGDDTIYMKTYWNQYKKGPSKFIISAGQQRKGKFQVCIWQGSSVLHHLDDVYYRDLIGIIKIPGRWRIVHCRGQYHPSNSGKVYVYET